MVLKAGLLPAILEIWIGDNLNDNVKKEALRISLWIVDNMCRYKPDWHLVRFIFLIVLDETRL